MRKVVIILICIILALVCGALGLIWIFYDEITQLCGSDATWFQKLHPEIMN